MKRLDIFRSKATRERNYYIASSLAAPGNLSGKLLDWSSRTDFKIRQLAMRFHQEWQHPDCLVMKWYKTHAITSFTSIQHWQNKDTQFFHEFLIIQLTDGSACRLERMGEGPRPDAVRHTGCNAYDLIQWFSPEDNLARRWFTGCNEMIVQVDFPCTFDLLAVLSVCHTIQHRFRKTSVYTLQRYNCYFLCCTVLIILTRRLESWDNLITRETHTAAVKKMVNDLRHVPLMPIKEQNPIDFFALGICSLVSPDSSSLAGFLVDRIESDIDRKTHDKLSGSLKDALWHGKLGEVLMAQVLDQAGIDFLNMELSPNVSPGDSPGLSASLAEFSALLGKIDEERFPCADYDFALMGKAIPREVLAACSSMVGGIAEPILKAQQMRESETKTPLHLRLAASTLGGIFGSIMLQPISVWFTRRFMDKLNTDEDVRYIHETLQKLSVTIPQLALAIPPGLRSGLTKLLVYASRLHDSDTLPSSDLIYRAVEMTSSMVEHLAGQLRSALLIQLQPSSGELNISAGLAWLNAHLSKMCWGLCLLCSVTRRLFDNCDCYIRQRNQATFRVHLANGDQRDITLVDFQDHVQQRIQDHADRVDSFRLAAGPLVSGDIQLAMAKIWTLLPQEHRGSKAGLDIEEGLDASDTETMFTIPSFIFRLPDQPENEARAAGNSNVGSGQ